MSESHAPREYEVRVGIPESALTVPVRLIINLYLERPPPPAPPQAWEATVIARVRAQPGGEIVGRLAVGERVSEIEVRDGWVRHAAGWTSQVVLKKVSAAPP